MLTINVDLIQVKKRNKVDTYLHTSWVRLNKFKVCLFLLQGRLEK
jgi:hypothetical protein